MYPQEKWYLNTWFISILFGCSYFVIPPFIGIVLLIIQFKENRKLIEKYGLSDELDELYDSKELEILENIQNIKSEKEKEYNDYFFDLETRKEELEKEINTLNSNHELKKTDFERVLQVLEQEKDSEIRKNELEKEITTLTNNFELKKTDFERVLQVLEQEKDSEIRKDELEKEITTLTNNFESEKTEHSKKLSGLNLELEMKKDEISKKINSLYSELRSKRIDVKMEINSLEMDLINLEMKNILKHYNFSDYDGISSEECKNKLMLIKLEEDDLIKSERALNVTSYFDKKTVNNNVKQILRCFNSECNNIMMSISTKNIDYMRNRISKSFDTLNQIFSTDDITLSSLLLEKKLEELNLVYTYELKKVHEQAQQKAIKEQMIEEEKARRDIEKEKAKIAKDQTQCNNEVHKLMQYLSKTQNDVEKQLYLDKIKELEDKLKELEISKENILSHEANALAGFVYIISNIGSFGEDIYKIGMTRRLEPMDRIKELSSASVPFEFDVHAMIFSDNAPTLETTLHQEFRENSINKINFRKEFFKISLDTVESFVKANFNNTVTFTKTALATEYRQTLAIS